MYEPIIEGTSVLLGSVLAVRCERTLRLPTDGRAYPPPPGLGTLSLQAATGPGGPGIIVGLHRCEALRLVITSVPGRPIAVRLAASRVNLLSGMEWQATPGSDARDSLRCAHRLALDQSVVIPDARQQFVAAGQQIEEQGGLHLHLYAPGRPGMAQIGHVRIVPLAVATYRATTGLAPSPTPVGPQTYAAHGYPWHEHYTEDPADCLAPDDPAVIAIAPDNLRRVRRLFGKWLDGE